MKRFGFPKTERLKSRKQIEVLFAGGKSFSVFPIRVTYQCFPSKEESGLQIGVTASKKYFKKAVERNRIKRLLREACRLQKETIQTQLRNSHQRGVVFFVYTGKTIASFDVIKTAMAKCLKRLSNIAGNEDSS